jgi:hypothetical protein
MTVPKLLAATAAALLIAATAHAQTAAAKAPRKQREFSLGGLIIAPMSLGDIEGNLLNGNGNETLTFIGLENKLAMGYGVEAILGYQLSGRTWFEVAGSWSRPSLSSKVLEDADGEQGATISTGVSRFALGGALVRYLKDTGRTAWFVRLDGAWMRETAGGNTLTGDGFIGGGGLGWRHFWRTTGKGAVKRMGLRIEGRGVVRGGGLDLGESSIKFGAAGAAHLVFGF